MNSGATSSEVRHRLNNALRAQIPAVWLGDAILGVLWLWSASIHWSNPYFFLESVLKYQIVSGVAAEFVASFLLTLELVLGLFLVFGVLKSGSRLTNCGLLGVFVVAQISAIARGIETGCGCFGNVTEAIGWWSVARTTGLFLFASALFWFGYCNSRRKMTGEKTAKFERQ